jgi:hypothetical protein
VVVTRIHREDLFRITTSHNRLGLSIYQTCIQYGLIVKMDRISAQVILKNVFLSFFLANTHHGYLMQRYPAAREGYTRIRKEEKKTNRQKPRTQRTNACIRKTDTQPGSRGHCHKSDASREACWNTATAETGLASQRNLSRPTTNLRLERTGGAAPVAWRSGLHERF